jgi:hypothetical protein
VGETVGPVPEIGVTGGVVDGSPGSASPVHAASASATQTHAIAREIAPENAPENAVENAVENLC